MAPNPRVRGGLVMVRQHRAGHLEGRARPGTGQHGETLASFLQSDVQGDLAGARALLTEIAAAERGEAPQPGGIGNAFSIAIGADGVLIGNAMIEDARPERYDLAEFGQALAAWIAAIERAHHKPG